VTDLRFSLPDKLDAQVNASLAKSERDRLIARVWRGDASVWTGADEARWLGWLRVVHDQLAKVDEHERLADEIASEDLTRVLLLGMGGSSLAADVIGRTFGQQGKHPVLQILDSTDPAQIRAAEGGTLPSTLLIVASKSGSTLEPNILKEYFFERVRQLAGDGAGRRFVAITDRGSPLEQVAARDHFRRVLAGDPTIGGRFSALSSFGMGPTSIAGVDTRRLLRCAAEMVQRCGPGQPARENPGAVLGTILGEAARDGRDKATLFVSPDIVALGAWLEQLLAESTGKNGKAIIPVDGESPAPPAGYGADRVFVYVRLRSAPDAGQDRAVDALEGAGQPVVRIDVADRYELGAEFFRWNLATAVAAALLQINPFDQPDVESAKEVTRRLAAAYESTGRLPQEVPVFRDAAVAVLTDERNRAELQRVAGNHRSLGSWLRVHFGRLKPADYAAVLAYIHMSAAHEAVLQRIRHRIRDSKAVATSVGFGPRYLHSTGQAYKGGPNTGVFLMITADDAYDLQVPGRRCTFGVIKKAQAIGDFEVLTARGRRALRVHLGPDVDAGLDILERAVTEALS
jgi:glucose-6-phosphate isomerase